MTSKAGSKGCVPGALRKAAREAFEESLPPIQREGPVDMSLPSGSHVAVVGAGVAGLQMGKALMEVGFTPVIFEASGDIGGVWREHYPGYHAQAPVEHYQFADFPYTKFNELARPGEFEKKWTDGYFAPGTELTRYIDMYVENSPGLAASIRLHTKVTKVAPSGYRWMVSSKSQQSGEERTELFAAVVWSVGEYCVPQMPKFKGMDAFKGKIIHSSKLLDPSVFQGKRTVVIGSGKSAADCTKAATKYGATTTAIVMRTPRWTFPRYVLGFIPFKYFAFSRAGYMMIPPAYLRMGGFFRSLREGRLLRAFCSFKEGLLWPLLWLYWRIVEFILIVQLELWGAVPPNSIEDDLASAGGQALSESLTKAVRRGELTRYVGAGIDHLEADTVHLTDGRVVPADLIVCATGFTKDYTPLNTIVPYLQRMDDGLYLYKQIFHPAVPRLFFVGSEVSTFNNILTSFLQAQAAAAVMSSRLQLPDANTIWSEMEHHKAWSKQANFSHDRAARYQAHTVGYHDDLVQSMRFKTYRKSNWLREAFEPYEARDFADCKAINMKRLDATVLDASYQKRRGSASVSAHTLAKGELSARPAPKRSLTKSITTFLFKTPTGAAHEPPRIEMV